MCNFEHFSSNFVSELNVGLIYCRWAISLIFYVLIIFILAKKKKKAIWMPQHFVFL